MEGMFSYTQAAMERTMKVQEVILRALAKKITWWQAAEIIGISDRQMRRWHERYEEFGYDGLFDRRRGRPSPKRVPLAEVERVLGLYREKYFDLNVQHFHEKLGEEHGIGWSYTWVKRALQGSGLVAKGRKRGVHRQRRERRPLPGLLLHIDGSHHRWFGDERWYDLIVILDDASSEIYYAQLVEEESTATVMAGLREVIERKGLFCALYSDRGSHFWLTPKAGGKVDAHRLRQVGLPEELRLRAITTVEAANQFLREDYMAEFNSRFQVAPAQPGSGFVKCPRSQDLDLIFALQFERTVNRDNTVSFQNLVLQIERMSWRATLAGCNVMVHQHLDGTISLTHGPHRLGRYSSQGAALTTSKNAAPKAVEKTLRGKAPKPAFPPRLEIPPRTRDSHFPTAATTTSL